MALERELKRAQGSREVDVRQSVTEARDDTQADHGEEEHDVTEQALKRLTDL